jgi:hypothetical protein
MASECKHIHIIYIFRIRESLIEDNFCPWVKLDYKTFYMNTVECNSGGYRQGFR